MARSKVTRFDAHHYKNDSVLLDVTIFDADNPVPETPLDVTSYDLTYTLVHIPGVGVPFIATKASNIAVIDGPNGHIQISVPPNTMSDIGRWEHNLRVHQGSTFKQLGLIGGFNVQNTVDAL